jgi:hypothetical protein
VAGAHLVLVRSYARSDGAPLIVAVLFFASADPQEYWVFAPSPSKLAARAALKKDIGHVKTSLFDTY